VNTMKPVLLCIGDTYTCRILGRLNRFTVLVELPGLRDKAYITNTGRLEEYIVEGRRGYCVAKNTGRLRHRLVAVEDEGSAALIDTWLQMKAFEKAVEQGLLPWMRGCRLLRRNPRAGSSILDYLARCSSRRLWIEVKSAAMRGPEGYAMYPDCPSLRGRRHLAELVRLAARGERAMVVFIAAVPRAIGFKPNSEGDPEIAAMLVRALESGVGARAFSLHYDPRRKAVIMDNPDLPLAL
jgi:sugar fermentation stimulation protein A